MQVDEVKVGDVVAYRNLRPDGTFTGSNKPGYVAAIVRRGEFDHQHNLNPVSNDDRLWCYWRDSDGRWNLRLSYMPASRCFVPRNAARLRAEFLGRWMRGEVVSDL